MQKLAIVGMAVLLATSAMAADLPLKRAAPQPDPQQPYYPPQAQAPLPVPQPYPQPVPYGAIPPVNPCLAGAGVFPPPLPVIGAFLGHGFGGGFRR